MSLFASYGFAGIILGAVCFDRAEPLHALALPLAPMAWEYRLMPLPATVCESIGKVLCAMGISTMREQGASE